MPELHPRLRAIVTGNTNHRPSQVVALRERLTKAGFDLPVYSAKESPDPQPNQNGATVKRKRRRASRRVRQFWYSCTPSCGFLRAVKSKEPCTCGANIVIDVHECGLLKNASGGSRLCVPLQSFHAKLPKDLQKRILCCETCPSRTPPRWITKQQLTADTDRLIAMLPAGITAVAGHARSGMLPATQVAMALHLPLWMIRSHKDHRDVIATGNGWRLDKGKPRRNGILLVVDDNCMTGNSLTRLRPIISTWAKRNVFDKTIEATVYANPLAQNMPDLFAETVAWPCFYEWNYFNSTFSPGFALDFDGVLCRDCLPDEDDDGEKYREFLRTAQPKFLPRREPVKMVITARREKWRRETQAWLKHHGVRVEQLVMHGDGPRTFESIVHLKTQGFLRFAQTTRKNKRFGEHMFVESDDPQAREIARRSKGMVICPTSSKVYKG